MNAPPAVTVVITAHNAASTIGPCLRALGAQEGFAPGSVQVILVDDRSDDGTADVATGVAAGVGGLALRTLRMREAPAAAVTTRQAALDAGIRLSSASVICLLDADAQPAAGWLRGAVDGLRARDASLWTAPVLFRGTHPWLPAFQSVDAAFYIMWCRALSHAGLAAGALFGNTAFTRRAYDTVGGVSAGGLSLTEDLAFARAVHRAGLRIVFGHQARVTVRAAETIRAFFGRALRTSAGGPSALLGTLAAWMLSLPLLAIAAWTTASPVWTTLFALRLVTGGAFAYRAARCAGAGTQALMAACYDVTALLLGSAVLSTGLVRRHVTWGGRRYRR